MNSANIVDSDIEGLSYSKGLQELYIADNPGITADGVEYLSQMDALVVLVIDDNSHLDEGDFYPIEDLPSLQHLSIRRNSITGECVQNVQGLISLDASNTNFCDSSLQRWSGRTNLHELRLRSCPIGSDGIRSLADCIRMENLDLSFTSISGDDLIFLSELAGLKVLAIEGIVVSQDNVDKLAHMTSIERLNISDCISGDGQGLCISALSYLPNLIELNVRGTDISESSIKKFLAERPDVELIR